MILIVMGVSGCGKTTIGSRLAEDLGWYFLDADDFHSPENIRRMADGQPLSDEDRQPWLARLRTEIVRAIEANENLVLACSALKESSRVRLSGGDPAVRFVYLRGSEALIRERLRNRSGHFMKADLLSSQFATLEEPKDAITVDIDDRPLRVVEKIRAALGL
jgi:gluconokinase